jgi:hypothetical protein
MRIAVRVAAEVELTLFLKDCWKPRIVPPVRLQFAFSMSVLPPLQPAVDSGASPQTVLITRYDELRHVQRDFAKVE